MWLWQPFAEMRIGAPGDCGHSIESNPRAASRLLNRKRNIVTLIRSSVALVAALCMGSVVACAGGSGSSGDGDGDGDGDMGDGDGDVVTGSGGAAAGTGGAAAGTGGTAAGTGGTAAGTGGTAAGTGGASTVDACAPFADFEDSDDGFGVYASENAAEGSLTKPVGGMLGGLATNDTSEGADGTSGSLLYAGSGYDPSVVDSGPGGIRFAADLTEACSDVTGLTGISFWAKGTIDATTEWGGVPANTLILYLVADVADEGGSQVDFRQELTGTWTEYQIPFADFGAEGYDATVVERVKFMLPGGAFDVGIDQVGFY
jgi:hypothetical protein